MEGGGWMDGRVPLPGTLRLLCTSQREGDWSTHDIVGLEEIAFPSAMVERRWEGARAVCVCVCVCV